MNRSRLSLGVLVVSTTIVALSVPAAGSLTPRPQNPSTFLLSKADMPSGWAQKSTSGTGVPGFLSALCSAEDHLTGACSTAGVRFAAASILPTVIEGLINWATPQEAMRVWSGVSALAGYQRTMLGHFGTASRTFEDRTGSAVVYTTFIVKSHFDAIVDYIDLVGPTAGPNAAYWDKTANALIPPKAKAVTPPTTTTTSTTPRTTTSVPATTTTTTVATGGTTSTTA
jgi:hypothetical protein